MTQPQPALHGIDFDGFKAVFCERENLLAAYPHTCPAPEEPMTTENARKEVAVLTRLAADTRCTPSERAQALLTAHQRMDSRSCLCGWDQLGKSHAGHQADVLAGAGLLVAVAVAVAVAEPDAEAKIAAALAEVCGYHEGDGCQHCAEVLRHSREREGWTDEQILADIALYRSDFDAWADKVRERTSARRTPLLAPGMSALTDDEYVRLAGQNDTEVS